MAAPDVAVVSVCRVSSRRRDSTSPSQRGLWLARQLADVVQARTADGVTSVRLYFPYRLTHRNPPRLAAHG